MTRWRGRRIAMPVVARRHILRTMVAVALVVHRCDHLDGPSRCRSAIWRSGRGEKSTHGVLLGDVRGGMVGLWSRQDRGRIAAVPRQDVTMRERARRRSGAVSAAGAI